MAPFITCNSGWVTVLREVLSKDLVLKTTQFGKQDYYTYFTDTETEPFAKGAAEPSFKPKQHDYRICVLNC